MPIQMLCKAPTDLISNTYYSLSNTVIYKMEIEMLERDMGLPDKQCHKFSEYFSPASPQATMYTHTCSCVIVKLFNFSGLK